MRWTEAAIAELTDLCFEEKTNAQLAEHFKVPVTEIYAKRSQLGLTIDKVQATKKHAPKSMTLRRVIQEKKELIEMLNPVFRFAYNRGVELELSDDGNTVFIKLGSSTKKVCIECDSHLAIIADVTRKCLY